MGDFAELREHGAHGVPTRRLDAFRVCHLRVEVPPAVVCASRHEPDGQQPGANDELGDFIVKKRPGVGQGLGLHKRTQADQGCATAGLPRSAQRPAGWCPHSALCWPVRGACMGSCVLAMETGGRPAGPDMAGPPIRWSFGPELRDPARSRLCSGEHGRGGMVRGCRTNWAVRSAWRCVPHRTDAGSPGA